MKKDYDIVIHSQFKNIAIIDYGIMKGNNTIIFIKAGQDGSMYGYEDKYLRIANSMNSKYGYTVICSSNPFDENNPLDNAMEIINKYCKNNNYKDYEIYYVGHSNGGLIGAQFGFNYSKIKKMLLVNVPLMFNLHKIKNGIQSFNGDKIVFVYGSLDQSYGYVELLKPLLNAKVHLQIIEGQDHYFSKDNYDFKKLPEDFLLK